MSPIAVQSSNIASISYSDETEVLTVEYLSGKTYEYTGVPKAKFIDLCEAPSKGSFMNSQIKGLYPATRI